MQIFIKIISAAVFSHPALHRLSETDQKCYPVFQLYFYKQGPPSSEILKSSLSKTLASFYPVAGRLVERSLDTVFTCPPHIGKIVESAGACPAVIGAELREESESGGTCPVVGAKSEEDTRHNGIGAKETQIVAIGGRKDVGCLDEGVLFLEACTASRFDPFLPDFQPHPHLLVLLPRDSKYKNFLLRVQVTNFACGGMCLGVVFLHNIFDGTSCAHFMECWVELANGKDRLTIPPYISQMPLEIMYLPREPSSSYFEHDFFESQNKIASHAGGIIKNKIFHFTSVFIDTLKHETSDETCKYSSFECIAAFMWRNVTLARGICSNEEVSLIYNVDGRGRLKPSLPPSYFGNVVFQTHVVTRASDLVEKKLSHTTNLIRKATSRVSDEHMREVLKWSTTQSSPMPSRQSTTSRDLVINSWTRLPLYGFNFGWGNPICCRPWPYIPFDYVLLLPALEKGHIEVVALNEEHLQKLESLIS